jgi:VIT1/CCC1 family predicted Fe2+/Mn2+ transporter
VNQDYSEDFSTKHTSNADSEFKALAKSAGWPSELVEQISVSSNIEFEYPDEVAEQIENLEYGEVGGAPNSVMRPFLARHGRSIAAGQAESFLETAIPKGVLE